MPENIDLGTSPRGNRYITVQKLAELTVLCPNDPPVLVDMGLNGETYSMTFELKLYGTKLEIKISEFFDTFGGLDLLRKNKPSPL